ncbi:PREDICTED: ceramide synthase 1-like, partial [Rhagoletis zephyria]|uniref:ceramide synthase 1-like n=1 Tax=Rhagoletis zephyria TaxID=28612 RepID=UPI0008114B83
MQGTFTTLNKSGTVSSNSLLTLFLHDGSDVLLEATKLVRYFKVQHGRTYDQVEIVVNIGFASFLLTWISNRLYWFPLKQVYVASVYVEEQAIQVPFITLLVGMLWIILLMNFYWFSFALKLLYKVASGQLNELEDNREFKEAGTTAADGKSAKSSSPEDARKLSIDSGVISVTGEETASDDGNESDKSGSPEEEEAITRDEERGDQKTTQQTTTTAAPNSPSSYNLRERR